MPTAQQHALELIHRMRQQRRIAVAFSGGVDSSVVAAAAFRALGSRSLAVTAVSPSVASWQQQAAHQIASQIGIQHVLIETQETSKPDYKRNDSRRCFYCKQTLYESIAAINEHYPETTIVSGTNADDLGDYRPGLEAASIANVSAPLAELGLGKAIVREIAEYFGLSNHATPASPCLASRVAYGTPVTIDRLAKIDRAESWLRSHGFDDVRVRVFGDSGQRSLRSHQDDEAKIEVPLDDLPRLQQWNQSGEVTRYLMACGFATVSIDPKGLRSGNLNEALFSISKGSKF